MGAHIDRGPMLGDFAPGYYYIVFEDPDGIRLEVNFVPGKGLLAGKDGPLSPSDDPNWNQDPAGPGGLLLEVPTLIRQVICRQVVLIAPTPARRSPP